MRIPKRFFWYWHDSEPPAAIQHFLDTWRRYHPDWEFVTLNESTGRDLIPEAMTDLWDSPEVWSPTSNPHQWRTNLMRLYAIKELGGVWIDADFECFKNVEPLIGEAKAFTSREDERFVNNGFWGAVPHHPWVESMVDQILPRVLAHPEWRSNRTTGPHLYTEAMQNLPSGTVKVVPARAVYPISYREAEPYDPAVDYAARYPKAYAAHFWNNKARREGKEFK